MTRARLALALVALGSPGAISAAAGQSEVSYRIYREGKLIAAPRLAVEPDKVATAEIGQDVAIRTLVTADPQSRPGYRRVATTLSVREKGKWRALKPFELTGNDTAGAKIDLRSPAGTRYRVYVGLGDGMRGAPAAP